MNVTVYNNTSDKIKVDKSITSIGSYTCTPFNDIDVYAPVIIVNDHVSPTANYMYIDDFSRYYFIQNISYKNHMTIITGRCDVLYTYKDSILNTSQYVDRCQTEYNKDITDNLIIPNKPVTQVKKLGSFFGEISTESDNCYMIGVK